MHVAHRFNAPGGPYEGLTRLRVKGSHRGVDWAGKVVLVDEALTLPLRWKRPRRIFVNSMSDLFHESLPDATIDRVFAVMSLAPQHTFQILTKRPARMLRYLAATALVRASRPSGPPPPWPLPNVWLGVSCEDQATADERIPLLLQTPAEVRFVSAEPLLGPADVSAWVSLTPAPARAGGLPPRLDLVICGGESGPGARPCDVAWIRSIVRQCKAAGVACFVKQLGARVACREEDRFASMEDTDTGWQARLHDPKGSDPSEWPEDLRVQEMPRMGAP
jgi:protein gp37